MSQPTLTPAYGRDYKSKGAVLADLNADKDFVFNAFNHPDDGRYVNASQLDNGRFTVRFARLTKVAAFTKRSKKNVEMDKATGATVLGWEVV
jgi:hypothetical protein